MKPASRESQTVVMLVGPNSAQAAMAPGEEHACRAVVRLERCPDVYRALARILAKSSNELAGVVVALECVGPLELAFFSNTSRLRPGLAVLVHARTSNEPYISRALASGATGVFAPRFWDTFVPKTQIDVPETLAPTAAIEPVTPAVDSVETSAVEAAEVADDPEAIEEEPETADPVVSPRVPWLRYSDGPARTAPNVRTPPPPTPPPTPATPPTPSEADYEPLLTDEELEALMADDISTIVPKADPSWRRNDPLGGRS